MGVITAEHHADADDRRFHEWKDQLAEDRAQTLAESDMEQWLDVNRAAKAYADSEANLIRGEE